MKTGILLCDGWSLEKDAKPFMDDSAYSYVVVNHAITRLRFKHTTYFISADFAGCPDLQQEFEEHPDRNKLVHVEYKKLSRLNMEKDDYPPYFANLAYSMLYGIHFLVCQGCTEIRGCGVNLEDFPNGGYHKGKKGSGAFHYNRIRARWNNTVCKDLARHKVTFKSRALNYIYNENHVVAKPISDKIRFAVKLCGELHEVKDTHRITGDILLKTFNGDECWYSESQVYVRQGGEWEKIN